MEKLLIKDEETEYLNSLRDLKKALISIVAILNKYQKGKIYFEMDNGQYLNSNIKREIMRTILAKIKPKIQPIITNIKINKKNYILVEFEGNDVPYFIGNKTYIRINNENIQFPIRQMKKKMIDLKKKENYINFKSTEKEKDIAISILDLNDYTVKNDIVKNDIVKNDIVKSDTVKNDTVKSDTVKNDTVKNDIVKNDTVKNDIVKNDTVKNDTVKNDTVKSDTVKNDTVKNDIVKNDIVKNDTVNYNLVLDEKEKKIIDELKENGYINLSELSKKLSIPKPTINRKIKKLKEKQIVQRFGSDKKGYWKVNIK